jgi:hypothetical protein
MYMGHRQRRKIAKKNALHMMRARHRLLRAQLRNVQYITRQQSARAVLITPQQAAVLSSKPQTHQVYNASSSGLVLMLVNFVM